MRRRVKALLQRLKLLGEFEALPAYVRDQFYSCCAPDPALVFDPSFPSAEAYGGKYAEVREEAIAGFRYAAIVRNRFMLEVKEFIAIAVPIAAMLRHTLASLRVPLAGAPRMPASIRAFMEKAIEPFNALCCKEAEADMYVELHSAVVVPLVGRSRLDGSLLHARLSM